METGLVRLSAGMPILETGNKLLGSRIGWMVKLAECPCSCRYIRPLHTLLSALVVVVALGVLVWAAETRAAVRRCRRSHPAACLAAVLAISLLILWAVGGAFTFLLCITAPVLCESLLSPS